MNKEQEMRLDPQALDAARKAIGTIPGAAYWNDCATIIAAYLAARRSSDEQAEVVGWQVREKSTQWDDCEWTEWRQASDDFAQRLIRDGGKVDDFRIAEVRPVYASPPAVAAGGVTAVEAAQMARTRLINFANEANAGRAQAGGRELARKVWGAFAEFDRLTAALAVGDEGIREGDDA